MFGKSKKQETEEKKSEETENGVEEKIEKTVASKKGPKIVKTTTKQLVVKDKEGLTENIEEKIEDLSSGQVHLSTHVNKVNATQSKSKVQKQTKKKNLFYTRMSFINFFFFF